MDIIKLPSNEISPSNHPDIERPQTLKTTWVANPYLQAATSENTRKAYRHDIRHYENWGGRLPATPECIVRYLETYAPTLNPNTLARRLIAIRHWHTYQGFADPTSHPMITKTMTGIQRIHGKPKAKARALSHQEMQHLAAYLEEIGTAASVRDKALLLVGFYGALRRSELVAIRVEEIEWKEDGIEILLPTSKTDPTHSGQYCAIPRATQGECPVNALEAWLMLSHIQAGAVFRRLSSNEKIGTTPLTPLSVNHILKQRAKQAGLRDIDSLSSHSLRRGLATSAAKAGAPLQAIMRAGRWKQTDTVMEYIEEGERLVDSAAGLVMGKLV